MGPSVRRRAHSARYNSGMNSLSQLPRSLVHQAAALATGVLRLPGRALALVGTVEDTVAGVGDLLTGVEDLLARTTALVTVMEQAAAQATTVVRRAESVARDADAAVRRADRVAVSASGVVDRAGGVARASRDHCWSVTQSRWPHSHPRCSGWPTRSSRTRSTRWSRW